MKFLPWCWAVAVATGFALSADPVDKVPRFSLDAMDRSIDPKSDFYQFACGNWLKSNPVPSDKARWSGFDELQQLNWNQIRGVLESASSTSHPASSTLQMVGDFFAAAMDTNRIETLRFKPIEPILQRIEQIANTTDLFRELAQLHAVDVGGLFAASAGEDAKNSSFYAFQLHQGGLGLPDRDYYLSEGFAKQRAAYEKHIIRMLQLLGDSEAIATKSAATILALETEMARASKSRVELRDPQANYNPFSVADLAAYTPHLPWSVYLSASGLPALDRVIVGQTNFLAQLDHLVDSHPIGDWKVYLRWHALSSSASRLHSEVDREHFAFYGTVLAGQPEQEPRWQRSAKQTDAAIGEALGSLYVERYFPAAARARMEELVGNLRSVFHERLEKAAWMSPETRQQALKKFDRFTQKIGHPEHFRDYTGLVVQRDDYFGNVERAALFETHRQLVRVGKPVDRTEWHMTPQTVNAYFNPAQNEIVFPAGILQPPFFDLQADDPINYGAIGVVIGHEITHGYDDQGRQYDSDGNLRDWWTAADATEFKRRAQLVIDQYAAYEALPGLKVNGQLTLGENLADLGGTSIAFEALQRALAKDPARRKVIDGFTPEQRFFLSLSQLWRVNWREAELRRRIVVDPHSPGQFRGIGPHVNQPEFFQAFGIGPSDKLWRPVEARAKIW